MQLPTRLTYSPCHCAHLAARSLMPPRTSHTKSLRNSRRSGCSTGSGDLSCGGSSAGSVSPVALRPTLASGLPFAPLSLWCLLARILDNTLGSCAPSLERFLPMHTLPHSERAGLGRSSRRRGRALPRDHLPRARRLSPARAAPRRKGRVASRLRALHSACASRSEGGRTQTKRRGAGPLGPAPPCAVLLSLRCGLSAP